MAIKIFEKNVYHARRSTILNLLNPLLWLDRYVTINRPKSKCVISFAVGPTIQLSHCYRRNPVVLQRVTSTPVIVAGASQECLARPPN